MQREYVPWQHHGPPGAGGRASGARRSTQRRQGLSWTVLRFHKKVGLHLIYCTYFLVKTFQRILTNISSLCLRCFCTIIYSVGAIAFSVQVLAKVM